jgi:hypothetical protein
VPEHRIITRVHSHETVNTDLAIKVRADDQLLGELLVSRGSIDWRPRGHQYVYQLSCERFDQLMQDHGRARRQ